ncbi:MAG: class I SAM-dependent methyltransferase [candidate division Zixibacteria bacterium]|nr:class I SAM-dependent methyltransferase [candidate division Zixibacteria bacterium]NIR63718.1 class I SAM-dependent methyltransferase [candidate division Zixibacteria bacterium]NIS14675.1 class I SAM-dependent methyltransferase [candidate division Zixibacteria bacterium]NIS45674.1 class I SAM-dependent methyltransferase [candidate division Zixibacteria bacterium]NIT51203.1 class I SAM-dependent methyltransferase [candidate division Zixibacteria bacterium]
MNESGGYSDHPFVAEFYDFIPPYKDRDDLKFWIDAAKQTGGPVLELGCGTGRVLIPTAEQGISATGLDLSESMLDICRRKLGDLPDDIRENIELIFGDIRDFNLDRGYNLITLPFRVFQHLISIEDQISCLKRIHEHLNPGGRLILDLFNPSLKRLVDDAYLDEIEEEPEFEMPDGRKIIRKGKIAARDYFKQVMDCELIYYVNHPDGRTERLVHAFPLRYFFRFEVEHLLARTGFEVINLYGDYDESEFGSKYPGEMILVAKPL